MDDIEEQLKKMMGNMENMPNILDEFSTSSASKDDVLRELKITNQHLTTLIKKIDTVLYYLKKAYGGPLVDTENDKEGLWVSIYCSVNLRESRIYTIQYNIFNYAHTPHQLKVFTMHDITHYSN